MEGEAHFGLERIDRQQLDPECKTQGQPARTFNFDGFEGFAVYNADFGQSQPGDVEFAGIAVGRKIGDFNLWNFLGYFFNEPRIKPSARFSKFDR